MDIKTEAARLLPELTELRRKLHRFPECSGHETKTTLLIRSYLSSHGIAFSEPAENITVASIGPETGEKTAFRADIDALPLEEASGVPYASENPGVMHACGHDAHTAIALCMAHILKSVEKNLPHRVVIIFQPSEETGEGAAQVLQTGILNGVSRIYALHVDPNAPSGTILVSPGIVSMGSGKIKITVHGKSGHACSPYQCNDALLCASRIVCDAQQIIPRVLPCFTPAVLSLCRLESTGTWNIIADRAVIDGLFRYSEADSEHTVIDKLRSVIDSNASITSCTSDFEYLPNASPVINDTELADEVKASAEALGIDVSPEPLISMADDFALYRKTAKICFVRVGIASNVPGAERFPLHSVHFRLEESSLVNSLAVMAGVLSSR